MRIISGTEYFQIEERTAVALGKFDGIHLGHRALLNRILEQKKQGLLAVVFTFEPAPAAFFAGKSLPELTTREEKRGLFEKMGIDVLIEFPMNAKTAATPPEEFIRQYLAGQMHMAFLAAGEDLSFGDKGKGNCELLASFSHVYDYRMEIIEKVKYHGKDPAYHGVEVSSTLLRSLVEQGKMEVVAELLLDDYSFYGEVVHGKQLGRTLGMPTVNICPKTDKLLPAFGVYYSKVIVGTGEDTKCYKAITNIGYKPTVDDTKTPVVESYLYNFQGDLYGKHIRVQLLSYRRPEMKFESVDALKAQMQQDIQSGLAYHGIG